jgi:hypothetical protein
MKTIVYQTNIHHDYCVLGTKKEFTTKTEAEKFSKDEYLRINGKNYFSITEQKQ